MKKPFLHAFSAGVYIVLIVSIINFFDGGTKEDTILAPIVMLSLLVLSVAFMAFVFFYEPIRMYGDGDKSGALEFFGKTLASFACLVVLFALILLIWTYY